METCSKVLIFFIVAILVFFVIFLIVGLSVCYPCAEQFNNEKFNNENFNNEHFLDCSIVRNELTNNFKGTSLTNLSVQQSGRFPIGVETATNWYNTQPEIPLILGTDAGKIKC